MEIKRMPVSEFRELGLLAYINWAILHPIGLALEVVIDGETGEESFGQIWDCREDPEGIMYADIDEVLNKIKIAQKVLENGGKKRLKALGFITQPLHPEDEK